MCVTEVTTVSADNESLCHLIR